MFEVSSAIQYISRCAPEDIDIAIFRVGSTKGCGLRPVDEVLTIGIPSRKHIDVPILDQLRGIRPVGIGDPNALVLGAFEIGEVGQTLAIRRVSRSKLISRG